MAASIRKAQYILSCQLCQASAKIKWRCEDCQMLMCDNCKTNIHPKVKTTFEHKIVDIRNLTPKEATSIPNLNDIQCEVHLHRTCCLFCETCKQLVCPTCISKTHQSHEMVELADIFQEKLNLLSVHDKNLNDLLSHYSKELEMLESTSREASDKFEQQKNIIENKETIIHERVSKYTTTLLDELLKNKKIVTEDTEKERRRVQLIIDNLEQRCEEIKSVKHSGRLEGVLSKETEIYECISLNKTSAGKFKLKIQEFQEGTIEDSALKDIVGLFQSPKQHSVEIHIEIVASYQLTSVPDIAGVSPLSSTSAWIWNWAGNPSKLLAFVQTADTKISVQRTVKLETNEVYDFCYVDQSKCIMTVVKDSSLYSFNTFNANDNKPRAIHNFHPLLPKAICVSGSEIIVGLRDAGKPWPVNSSSCRQVVVLSLDDCIVRKVFEYAKDGERKFTLPFRIYSSKNNSDIFVIDSTSEETGRVVAIDRLGEVKWVYTDPLSKPLFFPSGIVTTESGNLVLGCFDQSNLYVLSKYGQILTKYSFEPVSVSSVSCLRLDQTGRIWIGGVDKNEKGIVRIVNVTEC